MNTIKDVKRAFSNSTISKAEFINAMFDFHTNLFDFSENLIFTEISSIEISDAQIIFVSRKTNYHNGGMRFICDKSDKRNVTLEAFNFNSYERADAEMIFKLIQPDDIVFDIGGNLGWYSIHISAKLTSGKVYTFEPIPETFDKLNKNISLNHISNIFPQKIALSEKKQILNFFYSPHQTGAASSKNITENNEAIELVCESIPLDYFTEYKNIETLDFIKCDVEGAELFVFEGAVQTLEKFKPIVFTEMLRKWASKFGYHPNNIINLFKGLGYQCFYVLHTKLIPIDVVLDTTEQTNFLFLHASKHANLIESLTQ